MVLWGKSEYSCISPYRISDKTGFAASSVSKNGISAFWCLTCCCFHQLICYPNHIHFLWKLMLNSHHQYPTLLRGTNSNLLNAPIIELVGGDTSWGTSDCRGESFLSTEFSFSIVFPPFFYPPSSCHLPFLATSSYCAHPHILENLCM